ncbi:hypothetical protein [uncultured Aquimarina sp.]|uniref:hypothetical protein n=1 Tax=uncultured Aquimarina sp. TaxID=575652 RepID=UPI00261D6C83|nr:hypothetical protein [uncultured Aquimarina sp.]
MKTIKYIGALWVCIIIQACNSDDDTNGLRIVYEENYIETLFLEAGETIPPVVNWSGETGTFSATTLPSTAPDDLFRRNLSIDEETGVLSWDRSIPLGEIEIIITASSSSETASTTITIKNTFVGGLFYGGFNSDISDNPDISMIDSSNSINFTKEGIVGLLGTSGEDIISMSGTWTIDESFITVSFDTNNRVMIGDMNARNGSPAATFIGQWGEGLGQNNTIENLMGAFIFEND